MAHHGPYPPDRSVRHGDGRVLDAGAEQLDAGQFRRNLWFAGDDAACGGDRDRTKRKIMGQIAEKLADRIYVTDDNPRSENPQDIRKEILKGSPRGIDGGDRATAIERAVAELSKGDILLVAGKGHEQGQTIGNRVFDFDDVSVVRSAIAAIGQSDTAGKRLAH